MRFCFANGDVRKQFSGARFVSWNERENSIVYFFMFGLRIYGVLSHLIFQITMVEKVLLIKSIRSEFVDSFGLKVIYSYSVSCNIISMC